MVVKARLLSKKGNCRRVLYVFAPLIVSSMAYRWRRAVRPAGKAEVIIIDVQRGEK